MSKIREVVKPPKRFQFKITKNFVPDEFEEKEWFEWIKNNLSKDIYYKKTIFFNSNRPIVTKSVEYTVWFLSSDDAFLYKLRWGFL